MMRISLRNATSISASATTIIRAYSVNSKIENVKCLDDGVTLFRQMVRMNPLPHVVSFCKLFKTMLNMKHYSAVISLFREMLKLGIPISDSILNIMINNYCLMHRADFAFSVLPIYLKNAIPFDVVTFNTLLRGIFAENKVKDAVELFTKLVREKICEPDEVMYGTVMNGLSKRGHTKKTLSLLHLMEQGNTKPGIVIYNIAIDALCKDGNLDAAINLLNEMKLKGIPPDIVTYNSLIDGLCRLGQWEKLCHSLLSWKKREDIGIALYSVFINGLCKNGKLDEARSIFKKLSFIGLLPDVRTYNVMINGFCLEGLFDETKDILRKMEDNGCFPDNVTYNVIVQGFLRCSKISEMAIFMKEMARRGFSFDATTAELLVKAISKNPSVLDMIPDLHSKNKM
ncbi:hypothetical protein K7X08_020381 [Anisodus acutangulus]|uniref:Pentatricopeptide repeat-containing protein At1g12700, mitochondrial n=1 Tax=Anisodus acutangulus TaxID=402998 RepID=A0A9Q1M6D0_9SOLA|nr:hypothetical protein K7X08_020381 [Anisodus acutangulus]